MRLSEKTDKRSQAAAEAVREMILHSLTAMARGGIHDHVGGGFHRYSVDEFWHGETQGGKGLFQGAFRVAFRVVFQALLHMVFPVVFRVILRAASPVVFPVVFRVSPCMVARLLDSASTVCGLTAGTSVQRDCRR